MLKGQAKTDYQREYMRDYMRSKRASVKTLLRPDVKTLEDGSNKPDIKAKLEKAGIKLDGNHILGFAQSTTSPLKTSVNAIPLYNPRTSQPGDLVRKYVGGRYVEVTVKEVDADGNEVPSY